VNFPRLALAALAAYAVNTAYGLVVYGVLMADQFAADPRVFRGGAGAPLTAGLAASIVGAFVLAYVYAKGYEGSRGSHEGLRFGTLIGLLLVSEGVVWNHVAFRVPASFTLALGLAVLVQYIIVGVVLGLVYRPGRVPAPRRRA
jgi:hypothetical protein